MNFEFQKRILSSLILIPVVFSIIIAGGNYFNVLIFICSIVSLYEWHKLSFKKKYYFIGIIYLIISFYSAYFLRFNNDFLIFLFVTLICIFTDIGGYVFGKLFKGPKLTTISPKKTFSGLFGGFFIPFIFFLLLNLVDAPFLNQSDLLNTVRNSSFYYIIILSISAASQLGDILISYFKRLAKVKDTGKLIPGHGGLLDRIDGMLLAFPVAFFIFKNI